MLHSHDAGLLVTGSSGFIGSHAAQLLGGTPGYLDRLAPENGIPAQTHMLDLANLEQLRELASRLPAERILHLAAEAEVVTPWPQVGDVLRSNEAGTYNLVTAFQPRLLVFASTSAVYGNAGKDEALPVLAAARPLGLYGFSKAMGEILLRDWTHGARKSAAAFRLGNVVGARCRGLVPHLVSHARKYPDGSIPVRMRGFGKLVRDYVPVRFVTGLFAAALAQEWQPGTFSLFNAGTGRGTTNAEVAAIVGQVLSRRGWKLNIAWGDPVALGEAECVVLNMESTCERFGVPAPSEEDVRTAIEEAALCALGEET